MKRSFTKKYSFLIGLIIFIFIIARLDFNKLILILYKINYLYLFLSFLLLFPILIIKAYRWNYLKKKQLIIYNLKDSFLMYGTGIYFGILTPGRLGDLIKVIYLKNNQCSLGKSLVSVILDRLSDLFFLIFFGYLGMFLFFPSFQNFILLFTFILIPGLIILIIFLRSKLIQLILKKIFDFITPVKYQKSWKINFQDFINNFKIYKFRNYLFVFLITAFSWFIYYFQAYLLTKSIGINNLSFLFISIAVTIAGLVALLPVSILGIGTRDTILIGFFSIFYINQEVTVAFSFLILLMSVLMGLIGFFCWLIKPIHISK